MLYLPQNPKTPNIWNSVVYLLNNHWIRETLAEALFFLMILARVFLMAFLDSLVGPASTSASNSIKLDDLAFFAFTKIAEKEATRRTTKVQYMEVAYMFGSTAPSLTSATSVYSRVLLRWLKTWSIYPSMLFVSAHPSISFTSLRLSSSVSTRSPKLLTLVSMSLLATHCWTWRSIWFAVTKVST